jgi:hypothetical protein
MKISPEISRFLKHKNSNEELFPLPQFPSKLHKRPIGKVCVVCANTILIVKQIKNLFNHNVAVIPEVSLACPNKGKPTLKDR